MNIVIGRIMPGLGAHRAQGEDRLLEIFAALPGHPVCAGYSRPGKSSFLPWFAYSPVEHREIGGANCEVCA